MGVGMKVIVEIEGRNAIPVRAIPFLTNWAMMSPDVVADALAGEAHHFRGLASFALRGLSKKRFRLPGGRTFRVVN